MIKIKKLSIFKNEVSIITEEKILLKVIVEFDRKKNIIKLKGNVIAKDNLNNTVSSEYAEYDDNTKIFRSLGPTEIITSENYKINGKNIIFNSKENIIKSNENTIITDIENNLIYLDSFDTYQLKIYLNLLD